MKRLDKGIMVVGKFVFLTRLETSDGETYWETTYVIDNFNVEERKWASSATVEDVFSKAKGKETTTE